MKKSKIFMIASICTLCLSIIVSTYAMYRENLFDNLTVDTITNGLDYYISYDKGTDITSSTLNPSTDYTGGNSATITFGKKDNTYDIYGHIYLDIGAISSSLSSTTALKYTLLDTSGSIIASGNLAGNSAGSSVLIKANIPLDITSKTYTVYLWLDEQEELDPNLSSETLTVTVRCEASMKPIAVPSVNYISDLYYTAPKESVTNNNITYNKAPSVKLMSDRLGGTTKTLDSGNIRYYGTDPNNYVYFNCSDYNNQTSDSCEVWRIIGVFNGKIKIIRNTVIGSYSWDNKYTTTGAENNNGKNDWSTARLMKLLNPSDYYVVDTNDNGLGQSLYYNSGSGKCYSGKNNATVVCDFTSTGIKNDITRNLIAETTWNLGGWTSASIYSNQMYEYERKTTVYSGRPTTWNGKIALAYPSDYGYAAEFGTDYCNKQLIYYNDTTCASNNWLKTILGTSNSNWLLTPNSDSSSYAWQIDSFGNVHYNYNAYYNYGITPVLYLKSTTTILDGDGSSSNPYQLQ